MKARTKKIYLGTWIATNVAPLALKAAGVSVDPKPKPFYAVHTSHPSLLLPRLNLFRDQRSSKLILNAQIYEIPRPGDDCPLLDLVCSFGGSFTDAYFTSHQLLLPYPRYCGLVPGRYGHLLVPFPHEVMIDFSFWGIRASSTALTLPFKLLTSCAQVCPSISSTLSHFFARSHSSRL